MEDLIDFINRHVWVVLLFFLAVFGIAYAISQTLPEDFGKKSHERQIQIGERESQPEAEDGGDETAQKSGDKKDAIEPESDDGVEGEKKPSKGEDAESTPEPTATPIPKEKGVLYKKTQDKDKIVLRFAGDMNLADNYKVMQYAAQADGGVSSCFGKKLKDLMSKADLMMVNHEYSCSDEGEAIAGQKYPFRAKEKNNKELKNLGIDIVSLANNHVYDYGKKAFLNTLKSLKDNQIAYVGGGKNSEEAGKPVYYNMNGVKIAIVSATRAEKTILTPEADKNSPGVFYTYDAADFIKNIKEADKKSDYVIAYVHWGTEYSTRLESAQTTQAKQYVDAGADAVIGSHAHCLQGMEYYKGKPIIYNLGNFWFNDKTIDTGVLEVSITSKNRKDTAVKEDGSKKKYGGVKEKDVTVKFYPCIQSGCRTVLTPNEEEKQRILQKVNALCINTRLTRDGILKKE